MHLKISSTKWRPFYPRKDELILFDIHDDEANNDGDDGGGDDDDDVK